MHTLTHWLRTRGAAACLITLLALAETSAAEKVVIYRCTDASGAVTLQNDKPCPPGSRQEKRTVESANTVARPAVRSTPATRPPEAAASSQADRASPAGPGSATPSTAAPSTPAMPSADAQAAAASRIETEADTAPPTGGFSTMTTAGEPLPPPVLYECRTHDGETYLSENGTPQQRCEVLTTTGLGGIPASGAGTACEMKTDTCQRVPDDALCERWSQQLREAEAAERFGKPEDRPFARAEVERIGHIVRESVCGE